MTRPDAELLRTLYLIVREQICFDTNNFFPYKPLLGVY